MIEQNAYGIEWVLGERLADLTGLSVVAIYRKTQRGEWHEGIHFVRRDGRLWYSIEAYNQWVAGRNTRASSRTVRRYVSASPTEESAARSS